MIADLADGEMSRFDVTNFDDGVNVASGVEIPFDVNFAGIAGGDKVVEDLVDGLFVGDVAIAITVNIQLNGL